MRHAVYRDQVCTLAIREARSAARRRALRLGVEAARQAGVSLAGLEVRKGSTINQPIGLSLVKDSSHCILLEQVCLQECKWRVGQLSAMHTDDIMRAPHFLCEVDAQ